jgi:hypothetical protein
MAYEGVNCVRLVVDSHQWQVLVNMVMNFWEQ